MEKEEADRKAKEEADRKAKEEADRKAKEEADRKAKEDAAAKESPKLGSPADVGKAIFDAAHAKDKAAISKLGPTREELVSAAGEANADKVLKATLDGLAKDYGRLVADHPGLARGTFGEVKAPSPVKKKLGKDPSAVEVDYVEGAKLSYELDGEKKEVELGRLIRVGDGGWKVLTLLPKQAK
ncbi:hypothetical protein HY251_03705 [bacterium]|nr:hypothetical protein [bacterium]